MIYDLFMYDGEEDMLELRLNILDPYVDYFILGESDETFSANRKPRYYKENEERFAKWNHKIKYCHIPRGLHKDSFTKAGFQKNYLKTAISQIDDNDLIYFGDVDEIWKPQTIQDDKVYNLKQLNYSYFLNNRSSENWVGTIVGKWKTVKTESLNHWRGVHTNELDNGGWHFTNCMIYSELIRKIESYDHHAEANIPWVRENLVNRMMNNEDYLGREKDWQGNPFQMWIDETELPQYILENKDKLRHLWK